MLGASRRAGRSRGSRCCSRTGGPGLAAVWLAGSNVGRIGQHLIAPADQDVGVVALGDVVALVDPAATSLKLKDGVVLAPWRRLRGRHEGQRRDAGRDRGGRQRAAHQVAPREALGDDVAHRGIGGWIGADVLARLELNGAGQVIQLAHRGALLKQDAEPRRLRLTICGLLIRDVTPAVSGTRTRRAMQICRVRPTLEVDARTAPSRHPGAAWTRSAQAGFGRDPSNRQLALACARRPGGIGCGQPLATNTCRMVHGSRPGPFARFASERRRDDGSERGRRRANLLGAPARVDGGDAAGQVAVADARRSRPRGSSRRSAPGSGTCGCSRPDSGRARRRRRRAAPSRGITSKEWKS